MKLNHHSECVCAKKSILKCPNKSIAIHLCSVHQNRNKAGKQTKNSNNNNNLPESMCRMKRDDKAMAQTKSTISN